MIIGIDIGNTTTEFGLIKKDSITSYKFNTDRNKTIDDWLINIEFVMRKNENPENIIISSVVPQIEERIERALRKFFNIEPVVLGRDLEIPIKVNYENPKEVGVDRLLNAYASLIITKPPVIVVDLGTAITFDIVNKDGEYDGGMIFPGMESSIEALFLKAAKLPKVRLEKPSSLIGKNTTGSIQSGIYYGYISIIEGMVEKITDHYNMTFDILLTGGNSSLISSGLEINHKLIDNLSLLGIKLISGKF